MKKILILLVSLSMTCSFSGTYNVVITKENNKYEELVTPEEPFYEDLFEDHLEVSSNAVWIYDENWNSNGDIATAIFNEERYMQVKSSALTLSIKLKENKKVKGIRLFYSESNFTQRKQARKVNVYTQPPYEEAGIPSSGFIIQESLSIPLLLENEYKNIMFENETENTNLFHFVFSGSSEGSYQGLQYIQFIY